MLDRFPYIGWRGYEELTHGEIMELETLLAAAVEKKTGPPPRGKSVTTQTGPKSYIRRTSI